MFCASEKMMTLNMSNKFEDYYAPTLQQLPQQKFQLQSYQPLPAQQKETIHSGQFMVSHFEAEEAQEDDDSEIKMPDPDDPSLEEKTTANLCTEVQRYVPKKAVAGPSMAATTQLEIETSLSKLFKCMNLAYIQKLTSPKWNHFKGVRLRWKDKIRLNNVIWRCWHMQFILKKKTPVCQFASPLDADIHNNPQSVVLEGKYWKRQLIVIKAEYRKWRKNYKTKSTGGSLICGDTRSEFDFLEWSPTTNDRAPMVIDDWTSDTLFSAINVPFPFPDPREIARGAGIADFIQPSLGPLQPNLEDIDINTFQELWQCGRLPTVPEEVPEDIFKGVTYDFPEIMGTEQMDSATITEITDTTPSNNIVEPMDDTNMLDLNAPLSTIQYNDKMYNTPLEMPSQTNLVGGNIQILDTSVFRDQITNSSTNLLMEDKPISLSVYSLSNTQQIGNNETMPPQMQNTMGNFQAAKNILKGRVSKSARPFRREPHNYDKAQPTTHQTNIYQQMLAEQQQQQQQQQQTILPQLSFSTQFTNNSNLNSNAFTQPSSNILNIVTNTRNIQPIKSYSIPGNMQQMNVINQKVNSSDAELLTMLGVTNTPQEQAFPTIVQPVRTKDNTSYVPFQTPVFKKAQSAGYINVSSRNLRQPSPPHSNFTGDQQQQQQQTLSPPNQQQQQQQEKGMFRSNSLPLNSTFQKIQPKDENFAVPKFQAKPNRSRARSHSMQQHSALPLPNSLQAATSEPMLNSTLAQLLTTKNTNKLSNNHSSSTSSISVQVPHTHSLPPSGFHTPGYPSNSSNIQMQSQQSSNQQQHVSPTRTASLPGSFTNQQIINFSSGLQGPPPSLSPDFIDQDSPLSPARSISSASSMKFPKDSHRRAGHIHAEQKRRYNIKNGFDMLHSLIPQLQQNPNAKLSKAAMLQKGAEYIKQLRAERSIVNDKMEALRKERDNLNNSLTHLHSILPANGAPVSRQRTERVKQLYNQYVRYRTIDNWKFWILGLILEPLINSYTNTVSMASIEELYRTALLWVDQHCSLVDLRPAVTDKLRYLSTTTDILSDPPSTLQEEVLRAVNNASGQHPNLSST